MTFELLNNMNVCVERMKAMQSFYMDAIRGFSPDEGLSITKVTVANEVIREAVEKCTDLLETEKSDSKIIDEFILNLVNAETLCNEMDRYCVRLSLGIDPKERAKAASLGVELGYIVTRMDGLTEKLEQDASNGED